MYRFCTYTLILKRSTVYLKPLQYIYIVKVHEYIANVAQLTTS